LLCLPGISALAIFPVHGAPREPVVEEFDVVVVAAAREESGAALGAA
jgi:hypothetical protein